MLVRGKSNEGFPSNHKLLRHTSLRRVQPRALGCRLHIFGWPTLKAVSGVNYYIYSSLKTNAKVVACPAYEAPAISVSGSQARNYVYNYRRPTVGEELQPDRTTPNKNANGRCYACNRHEHKYRPANCTAISPSGTYHCRSDGNSSDTGRIIVCIVERLLG